MPLRLSITVGILAVIIMFRRPSQASGLAYFSAYVFYFCYGPIIGYLITGEIFRGTVLSRLNEVADLYAIVMTALLLADLLVRRRSRQEATLDWDPAWRSWTYSFGLLLATAAGVAIGARVIRLGPSNKVDAIAAAGPYHYQYLLLASILAIGTVLVLLSSRKRRKLLVLFWLSYIGYCITVGERDFIFAAFVLLIHYYIVRPGPRATRMLILGGAGALIGGSLIFVIRGTEQFSLSTVLGQGSTVFVDSFVIDWMANGGRPEGNSFLQALVGADPTAVGTWSEWISYAYTGSTQSQAQYGFSLIAESYLNWGPLGVFFVFFIMGLGLKLSMVRSVKSEYWHMFSIAFMYFFMYNIRGHAYAFVSALLYSGIIVALIRLGHKRPRKSSMNMKTVDHAEETLELDEGYSDENGAPEVGYQSYRSWDKR